MEIHIEEHAALKFPLNNSHRYQDCILLGQDAYVMLFSANQFEIVTIKNELIIPSPVQKLISMSKEKSNVWRLFYSNDCFVFWKGKTQELIAYDLKNDQFSKMNPSQGLMISLQAGGPQQLSYIDGKLYYFDGSAVYFESELMLKCQIACIAWHRPNKNQADASLVNVTGVTKEGQKLICESIVLSSSQQVSLSMIVRAERFEIEFDQEISDIKVATNPRSFRNLLTFQLKKKGWQAYLADPFGSQTIINIYDSLKKNVGDSTLTSQVLKSSFDELAIVQFSNYNVAAFDELGQIVTLGLPSMYNQNATFNFHLIAQNITRLRFYAQMVIFTALEKLHIVPIKSRQIKELQQSKKDIMRKQRKIATAYPVNVLQGVIVDDKLYNNEEKVFFNTFCALQSHQLDIRLVKQAANTTIWLLKQQQFMIALKTIESLRKKLYLLPAESSLSRSEFQIETQILNQGKIKSHLTIVSIKACNGQSICRDLCLAVVLRLFHCFNQYKNKQQVGLQLVFAIKYLRDNFGEFEDLDQVIMSMLAEFESLSRKKSHPRLAKQICQCLSNIPSTKQGTQIIQKIYSDLNKGSTDFKENQLKVSSAEFLVSIELIQAMLEGKRPSLISLTEQLTSKNEEIFHISKLKMYPYQTQAEMKPYQVLQSSFCLYLNQIEKLLELVQTQSIDDYLLSIRYYVEARSRFKDCNSSQIFARLFQLMLLNKYTHKSTLACLVHSLPAYDITTPSFQHIAELMQKGSKTHKVPQLITFLQKKIAKFTRSSQTAKNNEDFSKNASFLIDSFAILSQSLNLKISVQTGSLANAPSIRKGILDCVSVSNQEKVKNKSILVQPTDELKLSIWKVILFLWKAVDPYSSTKLSRQGQEADHILREIRTLLIQDEFKFFLKVLPGLLSKYTAKLLRQIGDLCQRLNQRINQIYWQRYLMMRERFGFKLNYSVVIQSGSNGKEEVKLRKRIKKSELRQNIDQQDSYNHQMQITGELGSTFILPSGSTTLVQQDNFVSSEVGLHLIEKVQESDQNELIQDIYSKRAITQIEQNVKAELEEQEVMSEVDFITHIEVKESQNEVGNNRTMSIEERSAYIHYQNQQLEDESQVDHFNFDKADDIQESQSISMIGKQENGRAVSPLEHVDIQTTHVFDVSIHQQINMMKQKTFNVEALQRLQQFVWKKQTQLLYQSWYSLRLIAARRTDQQQLTSLISKNKNELEREKQKFKAELDTLSAESQKTGFTTIQSQARTQLRDNSPQSPTFQQSPAGRATGRGKAIVNRTDSLSQNGQSSIKDDSSRYETIGNDVSDHAPSRTPEPNRVRDRKHHQTQRDANLMSTLRHGYSTSDKLGKEEDLAHDPNSRRDGNTTRVNLFLNLQEFVSGLRIAKRLTKTPSPRRLTNQLKAPKISKAGKKLPIQLLRPERDNMRLNLLLLKPNQRGFTSLYKPDVLQQHTLNLKMGQKTQKSKFIYFD